MLRIDSLSVQYGAFKALHNVSLTVQDGLIVSIVGANGAGKTTLLNTISGLLRPVQGRIYYDETELTAMPAHQIARFGIVQVPEGRKLFPAMTVQDNLLTAAMYPRAKASRQRTLEEVYQLFPVLRDRSHQLARTLSGGEQQMLAIGRSIMAKPRLIMLDEPSLGLAPLIVRQIFEVVQELKRRGQTVLLVEQNVRHSLLIADYAYVLEVGHVILEGPGHKVLNDDHIRRAYLGR
ncbi:MAG: ABC transporter ATP-binding protein [Anaerolineae bacterium]